MIDFHCHLDLYPNARALFLEVAKRNLFTLVVTTSPRAWQVTSKVFVGKENVRVALGLHPEVAEAKAPELDLLLQSIRDAPFVGEIGLDGTSKYKASFPLQTKIFREALAECQRVGGRVISIHSRAAPSEVLDSLADYSDCGFAVLHWFSGTKRQLGRAIDLGCWFSVGPAMLAGAKGRELAAAMPPQRVMPETDGPFATEMGKPLMPWESSKVIPALALAWKMPRHEIEAQLRANLEVLVTK